VAQARHVARYLAWYLDPGKPISVTNHVAGCLGGTLAVAAVVALGNLDDAFRASGWVGVAGVLAVWLLIILLRAPSERAKLLTTYGAIEFYDYLVEQYRDRLEPPPGQKLQQRRRASN
jgi:hypothetical protein